MKSEIFYFPGWTRKAVSFTIDDGNVPLDRKFLNIVRPAGIYGTFNLTSVNARWGLSPEGYRELYRGYEIANHVSRHPFAMSEPNLGTRPVADEPFPGADKADKEKMYKTDTEGVYLVAFSTYWSHIATREAYVELVKRSQRELEEVFGEGNIVGFVWPYHLPHDLSYLDEIMKLGYLYIRRTGYTDFSLPETRERWSYGAHHANLLERAAEFEAIEDDGELRFFCFGVHSHDFENNNCWDVLETFADKYGNRPEDFWYATVREVFEYEDALRAATVTESGVINNSDKVIYMKHNGKRVTLHPHCEYKF